ncbi:phosphopentomutase [Fodinibius salsisoli]|uniref:Phosphopentomutase n=1 Tax=Fodinibius salsisoli TaxID=2820877 RepID=A0ABT3PR81_9BACT|nr:phosphopentomutase [Fodinibius salsisoli]MCW9708368.1 phosphopentomutase [Fodinibius salsisoli]
MGNCYVIVIDGLGVGAQEDAAEYGDENENTLAHLCEATGCKLPNFQKLGLGNIIPLSSVPANNEPLCAYGKMREQSAGKDSTTGHWELAGITLDTPFPTYSEGFPNEVIQQFCGGIGVEDVLVNKPYSGTEVIADYGEQHLQTGLPIVYTSADSVFQVAAHVDVTPIDKLYEWCDFARQHVCTGEHGVGRVIARPFKGTPGDFERISDKRHDFSIKPPMHNLLSSLQQHKIKTYSIGKVVDLFSEELFTQYRRTKHNAEGISQLLSLMSAVSDSFVFINLIDTDQKYGHRLDPAGYAACLQQLDRAIPAIISKLQEEDLLIITGDHGNDPTSESTDHSREFVPILLFPASLSMDINLGTRQTFSDVASTVSHFFGINVDFPGESMLTME